MNIVEDKIHIIRNSLFNFFMSMPVFINQLMRIDWFSETVVGEESTWISFYGSYLGGIIGGILTLLGVILTINFQNERKKMTDREKDEFGTKIIDSLVDRVIANLLFIVANELNDNKFKNSSIDSIKNEVSIFKKNTEKMNDLPWDMIPKTYYHEFNHIRELCLILVDGFERIFSTEKSNERCFHEIKNHRVLDRFILITSQYIKFAGEKEIMIGLHSDLVKLRDKTSHSTTQKK